MKQLFNFALIGAIALTSATMFVGCNSSEDAVTNDVNPTFDPVAQTVTSQFVLNIASDTKSNSTRSAGTTVQADGENFRGLTNAVLLAYQTGTNKHFVSSSIASSDAGARYDLGTLLAKDAIDNNGNNSNRILELAIPTETDAMLFYGKAIKGTLADNENGKVSYNVNGSIVNGTTAKYSFSLNQRIASGEVSSYTHEAAMLAALLSDIVDAPATYTVDTEKYPDWTGGATISASWKTLNPTDQERALSPLEDKLYTAFKKITTFGSTEFRAGSVSAIVATIKDLHKITASVATATPTTVYEELGKRIAEAINTKIAKYFSYGTGGEVAEIKAYSVVKTGLQSSSLWNDDWTDVIATKFTEFPTSYGVPEGAAILTYTSSSNTFSYKTTGNSLLDKNASAVSTVYQYPAELMYYCNSALRTSDVAKKNDGYPNGVGNWDDDDKWEAKGDWSAVGSKVTSTTRATAMAQNVNYGVAMLKTTVGIKAGVTGLSDNRKYFFPNEDNNVIEPSDLSITLKGIIIGGQPVDVDWQFLPTSTNAVAFDKIIYDNSVGGSSTGFAIPASAGSYSSPNYTIVFDNYKTGSPQNKVKVALEFVNTGDDFWGRDNLVLKGQTFYLVAELDPAKDGLTPVVWDEYYQVPPLDADGKSTKTTRVFIQDYMTTAKFQLSATSLQKAYVTLPDLRSSQLSFGLSVDLDWRTGLEFTEELGGN